MPGRSLSAGKNVINYSPTVQQASHYRQDGVSSRNGNLCTLSHGRLARSPNGYLRMLHRRDLKLRRLERFVYEYDFGDSWVHDLRLEVTPPINPRTTYPTCVAGKCAAPPKDCGGPHAFMANRGHSAARGRRQSIEELDDFEEELDDEVRPHGRSFDYVRRAGMAAASFRVPLVLRRRRGDQVILGRRHGRACRIEGGGRRRFEELISDDAIGYLRSAFGVLLPG